MQSPPHPQQPLKVCFVTVGATAAFHMLLQGILDSTFLHALHTFNYTNLLIQFGVDGQVFYEDFVRKCPPGSPDRHGIEVESFAFKHAGLDKEMKLTKAEPAEGRIGGLVISHAGSGSILGALRLGVPLVVVPNPTLKDNHQVDLANELQKQGYVVATSFQELPAGVERAEGLRSRMLSWPPVYGADQKQQHRTLEQVMSDEMGFLD